MKVCKVSKTLCRCAPATAAMPHAGVIIQVMGRHMYNRGSQYVNGSGSSKFQEV